VRRYKRDAVEREFAIISMRLLKLSNDFKHLADELQRERDSDSVGAVKGNAPAEEDGKSGLRGVPPGPSHIPF